MNRVGISQVEWANPYAFNNDPFIPPMTKVGGSLSLFQTELTWLDLNSQKSGQQARNDELTRYSEELNAQVVQLQQLRANG